MQYFISFLEGIITFISPCLLPMLPVYVSYFAGGENNRKRTFKSALGFVLGFTIIFVCMGAFAGGLGGFLKKSQSILYIVGVLVGIIFGLNFMGVLKISFLNTTKKLNAQVEGNGFFRSVLFGMVFSIGWTPCVGTFLGSALLMASRRGSAMQGILMLILFSLGLGIPFLISAVLIDRLKEAFRFIKTHYKAINTICGIFLIVTGIFMMTGTLNRLLGLLSN